MSAVPVSVLLVAGGVVAAGQVAQAAAPSAVCTTRVASDFNGDGFADVAAGEPERLAKNLQSAGAVRVEYGSASGVVTSGDQYFDQDSSNIPGAPTDDDEFGYALASGFFNDDCYADLAIGTPGENDVTILLGSAAGLTTTGAIQFKGQLSKAAFGAALAVGDFNHDGFDDLVAGAPDASDAGHASSGEIGVMYGGPAGLTAPKWLDQSSAGMPGAAESGDLFGASLAAGDFTGDGRADLAIGVPWENNGSVVDGGSVTVIKGSSSGLTTSGAQLWTQSSSNVPGTDEKDDEFGYALAAGDVNGDGHADLIVGTPLEDVGSVKDAGDVTYLPGTSAGVTGTHSVSFSQSSTNVAGTAATDNYFGISVAVGDFDGDGHGDIAIGTPNDQDTNDAFGGSVSVLPGTATGPTATGSHRFSQETSGVPGTAEDGDAFGLTLLVANVHGSPAATDLLVAAPYEGTSPYHENGAITVLPGTTATGLTGTGSQTFSEPTDHLGIHNDDHFGISLG